MSECMNSVPRVKITHLTSVHQPFDGRIFHKECKTLHGAGYEVSLVAEHDRSELVDGVQICAVKQSGNRRERMTRTVRAISQIALAEGADVFHFHDPELIPLGIWLKAHGKRVIYDVHEDFPKQLLSKPWITPWLRHPLSVAAAFVESAAGWLCDGIVAATPEIARRFPKRKTVTIQNFPLVGELDDAGVVPYCDRSEELAYVGGITANNGAKQLLTALASLPNESKARLLLAGAFSPESLRQELQRMPGWSRVEFLGWQSRPGVAAILGRARAGLVTAQPISNYLDCWPTKMFEYMAAGLPVIASDLPRCRQIVESTGCGILVDPHDPQSIADAIQWLMARPIEARAMGQRGQEAFRTKYNWAPEAQRLLAFYRDAVQ
jgi:glycosyltransferase involved in cell wall biosynthesis